MKKFIVTITLLFTVNLSWANDEFQLSNLKWVDEGYLTRQRSLVEEITKMEFGSRLRKNMGDVRLLQRIIDTDQINQTQTKEQQALGVVLGDVFVTELNMQWRVYEDLNDHGNPYNKSRAVCLKNTTHCLFPITMLSKRMKLGVKPNALEMFKRGKSLMAPYMPRLPYSKRP